MELPSSIVRRLSSVVLVSAALLLVLLWRHGPTHGQGITPTLVYSSYLGGSGYDVVKATAVDGAGNIYLAGWTSSRDFPTVNALQPQYGGGEFDAFVAKMNPAGTALLFSTYLGGSDDDFARGIAVDGAGNVYVSGSTQSRDFPLANAIQPTFGGGYTDAFISKLSPSGSMLLFSTYLGGSLDDRALALAMGGDGRPVITGYTESEDFPVTRPLQTYCGAATYGDVFVSKLDASGAALAYSTYLCGTDDERGIAVAADAQGSAYVTGYTDSADFPTANAYQPTYAGYRDIFLTKLDPSGSAMLYSTYIGGKIDESGWGIAVDPAQNVYLTGFSRSPDFPLEHPIQPKLGGGDDAFVAKVAESGQALLYSTFLGGSLHDFGEGIAVDGAGSATLIGWTSSSDFPVVNALQPEWGGGDDAFVAKVNSGGTAFTYATFLGGDQEDRGWGVALDGAGEAVVAGHTYSPDFPLAAPYQPGYAEAGDGFVARIGEGVTPTPTPTCAPSWRVVDSPNGPGSNDSELLGMATVSTDDIWAVGRYVSNNVGQTLALHWNGSQWSQIASPNRGFYSNVLIDVADVSSEDVWAVGYSRTESEQDNTLTEHWDGVQWSIVPSPNSVTTTNVLRSVSAISSTNVWAVGYFYETIGIQGFQRTLVQHWDGTQWSIVPSPNRGVETELWSVSALAPNDVWAAGSYLSNSGDGLTLVEHWDGTQWTIIPSPNPLDSGNNALYGVSAIATDDVWVVGRREQGPGEVPLTMHWDGTQWTIVPAPNMGPRTNQLSDVAAISTNDVWAVGYYCCGPGNPSLTLAMHWDGVQWSLVPSPNPGNTNNYLRGLTALSTGDVWAVGYKMNCGGTGCPWTTLTEHYTDALPCLTPLPSYTPTNTPTATTAVTNTPTITQTPTPCPLTFTDVHPTDYFYQAVRFLYCRGIVSGYGDGSFRPYNNTTRAQLCKIVVLAEGWPLECPQTGHFSDVPPGSPFYCFVETAYSRAVISGYGDGTFRPGDDVTRRQICKIVVLAEGWSLYNPARPTFSDVTSDDAFYEYVETAHLHAVVSGYADGTFHPGASATRGQICKVVYLAVSQ